MGDSLLAGWGCEGISRLNAAGDPVAVAVLLAPGDDLQGVAATDMDGLGGGGVCLELVIDVELAVDDIPSARTGQGLRVAFEFVVPY